MTCPVTQTIYDEPPRVPNADPFGVGHWYVNADRTIWAGWEATSKTDQERKKVMWIKPKGTFEIRGRRLDADALPLSMTLSDGTGTGFEPTSMFFPTPGCWEVTGSVSDASLTFVTLVTKE